MANLTLAVDDGVLQRARIRAIERGTSVNAMVRGYLVEVAGDDKVRHAMKDVVELALRSTASSGPAGRTWTREELYDL
ncbi:MAG: hypothetical protein ACRDPW_09335 [Mycobacteriales bacterium]